MFVSDDVIQAERRILIHQTKYCLYFIHFYFSSSFFLLLFLFPKHFLFTICILALRWIMLQRLLHAMIELNERVDCLHGHEMMMDFVVEFNKIIFFWQSFIYMDVTFYIILYILQNMTTLTEPPLFVRDCIYCLFRHYLSLVSKVFCYIIMVCACVQFYLLFRFFISPYREW